MRKPWVYKRKDIKGRWTGWYEGGERKAKAFPTKGLAEHYRHIKYTQLNSDVFTGIVSADWQQMVEEYQKAKQVEGLREASICEARLTLGHFERLVGPDSSKRISQNALDKFVLDRSSEVQKTTLNKDIRNLNAFLHWAVKNRFVAPGLQVKKIKVAQKPATALTPQQVRILLSTTVKYPTLRLRVLLAVTTGLRRGDIEAIRVGDIHRFSPKKWEKVWMAVGLPNLKFHDLRKTFASLLAQRGVSTAVTQRLLEHSSPQLTNEVYTNVDPVLRQAVDLLPVRDWV